jgi:dihydroflavonol-4-reductase
MKIAVTGATGHIGNVLCRILVEQGFEVRALYRSDSTAISDLNLTLIQGDVLNYKSLLELVDGCDVVINCAAIISIHGDPKGIVYKTNTEGPRNIVMAAIEKGVKKILHLSSTHAVYEQPLNEPFNESRPYKTARDYTYDYSKAIGEQLVLEKINEGKIEGCVLRPSSVLGIFDFRPSEIGKALLDFYRQKIPMLPPGGYNFIDVRDVAQTIISAISKGRNNEIYLLSGQYYSMKEFAKIVHEASGKKTPKIVMPFWFICALLPFVKVYGKIKGAAPIFTIEAIHALKFGHPKMDNSKAKSELNHTCRPLKETIADFYTWQKIENNRS